MIRSFSSNFSAYAHARSTQRLTGRQETAERKANSVCWRCWLACLAFWAVARLVRGAGASTVPLPSCACAAYLLYTLLLLLLQHFLTLLSCNGQSQLLSWVDRDKLAHFCWWEWRLGGAARWWVLCRACAVLGSKASGANQSRERRLQSNQHRHRPHTSHLTYLKWLKYRLCHVLPTVAPLSVYTHQRNAQARGRAEGARPCTTLSIPCADSHAASRGILRACDHLRAAQPS